MGRDFIIGDLHGCYGQLLEKFEKANFDPEVDRVFSVGDLTDRGPESYRCLQLINEPWFHSVLGNHETMLLQFFGARNSHESWVRDFYINGGTWIEKICEEQLEQVMLLAHGKMLEIPLRLTVRHQAGDFDLVHAQFWDRRAFADEIPYDPLYEAMLTWGRSLIFQALRRAEPSTRERINELFYQGKKEIVHIEPAHDPERRLTYVGHSVVRVPILTRSHLFIDTGAYEKHLNRISSHSGELTMIDHATKKLY